MRCKQRLPPGGAAHYYCSLPLQSYYHCVFIALINGRNKRRERAHLGWFLNGRKKGKNELIVSYVPLALCKSTLSTEREEKESFHKGRSSCSLSKSRDCGRKAGFSGAHFLHIKGQGFCFFKAETLIFFQEKNRKRIMILCWHVCSVYLNL